ncbi:MAG: hypothetical protein HY352_04750 [Candidatus Omnitrophica bacterium]|nr:hypothetical protein [Candidatus Omnitrophota bacterium]
MKSTVLSITLGVMLAGGLPMSHVFAAEENAKTLPTLLIKGEVVSLDSTDPSATLLKVKDRYGFETPIFLTPETKMTQGDAAIQVTSLIAGASVQVEYNFDVNTAKRHAVSVKLAAPVAAAPAAEAAPAAPAAGTPAPEATPAPAVTEVTEPAAAAPAETPAAAPAQQ